MSDRIAWLVEPLLRLLFPGRGRHRRVATPPLARQTGLPTTRQAGSRPLRGEDNHLVRPYLVAHERREEARRQRARRRALWLAVHGIDIGPRVIHGVEVTV
ncbi:hypothetical protein [Streptomyces poonensis]|uniref:Uncharacterized protein n=1 Tax=Streptomyces poonensis TaxID=68255 RepID=A0A918PR95_9ACTN|nr:hypothetical protein [Streptomyces poonensis]GGZ17571.1 hypothetical protein GCM10010365_41810 [Streptomyces poonensis]GLJ90963.1 hypothetical protein GCM10017589_35690 [Streptomyces poonensis]